MELRNIILIMRYRVENRLWILRRDGGKYCFMLVTEHEACNIGP